MSGIDTKVVSHRLTIRLTTKPVAQRKRKVGEEKTDTIEEDVGKLSGFIFITEAKYPTSLANLFILCKAGKDGACV